MRKALLVFVLLLIITGTTHASPLQANLIIEGQIKTDDQINDADAAQILGIASVINYQEIDEKKCAPEIRSGKIKNCLGEYAEYFTPEEFKKNFSTWNGAPYGGIGVVVSIKNRTVFVENVKHEYSAFKAGVRDGDIIRGTKENGTETIFKGADLEEVNRAMLGKIFTSYTLLIIRGEEPLEIKVTRVLIHPQHVIPQNSLLPGAIGYIRIINWNGGTAEQFNAVVHALRNLGAKKNLFDVRNNPGGLAIDALEAVTSWETDDNAPLVTKRGRLQKEEIITRAVLQKNNLRVFPASLKDVPCAVLINKDSGSASEIFAGFLKVKGCHIIGDTSFGKGTIQYVIPLGSGAAFKLTAAEYFIGLDIKIDGVGIVPTLAVSNPEGWEMGDVANDFQLKAALKLLNEQYK